MQDTLIDYKRLTSRGASFFHNSVIFFNCPNRMNLCPLSIGFIIFFRINLRPKEPATCIRWFFGASVAQHMKPFAEAFYKSKAWQDCRAAYLEHVGGLCECCLAAGRYTAAEIVHHKIPLTPENINAAKVTLNWDNLEAVCRECHAMRHGGKQRRVKVDEMGRVIYR